MTAVVGPRTTIEANPADRSSVYTALWVGWIVFFIVVEGKALAKEAQLSKDGKPDRAKRTLSANIRHWTATDSVTGIPVHNAKLGKTRRFAASSIENWFPQHRKSEGVM